MLSDSTVEDIARQQVTNNHGPHLTPLLLALGIDSLLMGVAINQFITWWNHSKKEATHVRCLLYLASFGAVAGTILTWATTLHMFSYEYGRYAQFIKCDWIAWYGILDPLTKISVQAFYAERAWRINKRNYWLLIAIGICLCGSVTGSVGYTIVTRHQIMGEFDTRAKVFVYLWPGACIAADIIITSSIMYGLYHSRSGLEHTDRLVKKLMRVSLEAQVPPTLVALTFFLQFAAEEMSSITQFIAIVHPKVYLVGCLAVLNSRENMRQNQTSYVHTSGNSYSSNSCGGKQSQGGVTVETETYVCADGGRVSRKAPGINRAFSDGKELLSVTSRNAQDQEAIELESGVLGSHPEFEAKLPSSVNPASDIGPETHFVTSRPNAWGSIWRTQDSK